MNAVKHLLLLGLRLAAVAMMALPLTACVTVPVPISTVTTPPTMGAADTSSPQVPLAQSWWEDFGDAELNRLVL
jgi:outer membrane protein TolC